VSKEASFLYNNWLFIAVLLVVLIGTLGEPITKWLKGVSTTFRGPYFNALNVPLGLMLLFLTGIGPTIAWRKATAANLRKNFTIPMIVGVVTALAVTLLGYSLSFLDLVHQASHRYALLTFFSCGFTGATIVIEFYKGARTRSSQMDEGYLRSLVTITRRNGRRYGGYIIHLAIVCIFAGFAGTAFNQEVQKAVRPGETVDVGRFSLKYINTDDVSRPTYAGTRLRMDVYESGRYVGAYGLEKRFYYREEQPTTEVAIRSTGLEDLYMVLASMEEDGTAVVKVHVNPLVAWIWLGGFMLAFGSVIAMWPSPAEQRAVAMDYALDQALPAASP
jgi:cytochrome c-type biogenesis protein CcmF